MVVVSAKLTIKTVIKLIYLICYDQDVVVVYHKSQAENIKSLGNK